MTPFASDYYITKLVPANNITALRLATQILKVSAVGILAVFTKFNANALNPE